jgi:hypothetical protein
VNALPAERIGFATIMRVVVAGVEFLQFRERHVGNIPGTIRGAIHRGVMDDNTMAVRAGAHVQLDHVHTPKLVGLQKCGERVFRHEPSAAAVCDQQRPTLQCRVDRTIDHVLNV